MKRTIAILSIMLVILNGFHSPRLIANDPYYNEAPDEEFCPDCHCVPCQCCYNTCPECDDGYYPPPEVLRMTPHLCEPAYLCGTQCGLTVFSIAIAIGLVVALAAIILSSGEGASEHFAGPGSF